jgi:hypothetical protein
MPILTNAGRYITMMLMALTLCSAIGIGWWVNGLRAENARLVLANQALVVALESQVRLRFIEAQVSEKHVAAVAVLKQAQGKQNEKYRKAVQQDAAWGDQMVPSGVADALGL